MHNEVISETIYNLQLYRGPGIFGLRLQYTFSVLLSRARIAMQYRRVNLYCKNNDRDILRPLGFIEVESLSAREISALMVSLPHTHLFCSVF